MSAPKPADSNYFYKACYFVKDTVYYASPTAKMITELALLLLAFAVIGLTYPEYFMNR